MGEMSRERWSELMDDPSSEISKEEWEAGWHWCGEFDGLLVNKNDKEGEGRFCTCVLLPYEPTRC